MYYNLKITEKQAEIIKKSLDLFARIGIGQFEEILRHPTWDKELLRGRIKHSAMARARMNIDEAKKLVTRFDPNASMSIVAADENSCSAYDIFQVIAHTLWRNSDNKEHTAGTVDARKPLRLTESAEYPLPEMNKCD